VLDAIYFILHVDTSEVKHNLSDPETPEDERKTVFGGNYSPTYIYTQSTSEVDSCQPYQYLTQR